MNRKYLVYLLSAVAASQFSTSLVCAEVVHRQINAANLLVDVTGESWQPDGFENGIGVPATYLASPDITIDGVDDEAAWQQAREIETPLLFGSVTSATLKAVYSDEEVFIRVRWADASEDREYRPWVWNAESNEFQEGSQIEDSVLLSFEAGCEWSPSLLSGYVYDLDGWHWMAARSDPLGQAVDMMGNAQDQDLGSPNTQGHPSRYTEDTWNMKFAKNKPGLYKAWDEVDRVYMLQPISQMSYLTSTTDYDGEQMAPPFFEQIPAPAVKPKDGPEVVPQFSPVKLKGGAGEVSAKGRWQDGFWTVEFRRTLSTPAGHFDDTIFQRITQFSVHVFDGTEMIDESSESKRLFLQFLPREPQLVNN